MSANDATTSKTTTSGRRVAFQEPASTSDEMSIQERRAAFRKSGSSTSTTFSTRVRRVATTFEEPAPGVVVSERKQHDSRFAFFIFVMLGIGVLLPWNAFIAAFDYFKRIYSNVSAFVFIIGLVFNVPAFFATFAAIKFGPKFSFASRTLGGLALSLVCLAVVPIACRFMSRDASMALVLVLVFLTSVAGAVLFGSVIGLAAIFPQRFTGAVMMGNGIAGVVVMALRVVTIFALPDDFASALAFFALSAFVLLLCIVLFVWLMRLPITRNYDAEYKASKRSARAPAAAAAAAAADREPLLEPAANADSTDDLKAQQPFYSNDANVALEEQERSAPPPAATAAAAAAVDDDDVIDANGMRQVSMWRVSVRLAMPAFAVFTTFLVTLILFPAVLTLIPSAVSGGQWPTWFQTVMTSAFMVGDWLGRSTPSFGMPLSARALPIVSLLRFGFFPLYVWCFKDPRADWIPIVSTLVMGYSNGLTGTLGMIYGPTFVRPHERETAGLIMTFALNFGIFCGVQLAMVMRKLLTGSFGIVD